MKRIAVTGGSGKLGRAVLDELAEHGHRVVSLDRVPLPGSPHPFVQVDLGDYGDAVGSLTGVDSKYGFIDAVVHLAALPAPGLRTNAATFHANMTASYNVFAAARAAGVTNIVWASSETVLGLPFTTPPPYLPVDEEYEARPESTYSLVKTLEETMAAQLCRWAPDLKMIGLRFSNVMEPADYAQFPGFDEDPAGRRWNLWSYIDARDGAQAVRRALDLDVTGLDVFLIANADTVSSIPSSELADRYFPDVPRKRELTGTESLQSIEKARRVLGYEPQYSWRTA
ncbi:NAD-dependent epimerase/dehydratase family protein [Cryptosporangium aurantiacum]|uniref:Nucleoside-diphosphate-sugar epimerase n=1 Tax=Cryptosporangium aurantiacum TaxID=134849 RepID=A0A1M7PEN3_9ACTN|nr:NAD(P)-dependent oxidoreductase [Cryptosporangium aurantiacum]SHN15442.1 Nucleoside-diphosphate-sugar epimerase [Cryptosporangium aurantiacum]